MSTNRTLHAVPTAADPAKPRTETEEKLWQAVRNNPGSTANALHSAAGIGKSTASKILARWDKVGLVARISGIADDGSRPADRWSITTDGQPINELPTDEQPSDERHTGELPMGSQPTDGQPMDEEPSDERPTGELPVDGQYTDGQPSDGEQTDEQPTDEQSADDRPTDVQPQEKSARLAPGALHGMVEDFLRDHPGEHGPNAIGKALNRSSGAVSNALERMVASGYAMRTCERPKKYTPR